MKFSKAGLLHQSVPPDWYERGIKENLGQRYWHHRRFVEVSKLIESSDGKILDIGSADGTFTHIILNRSKADLIVGIDVLPASINYAAKKFSKNKRLRFQVADAGSLPFKDEEFDAVFCLEVLEHVFSPKKVLDEVKRVLKKNGYVVILVPLENLLFKLIWFFWVRTKGKIWQGTHLHQFDHQKLTNLMKKEGFEILHEKNFLLGMLKAVKLRKK